MIFKALFALVLAAPALASDPKEMPPLWYDLIAAEELAKNVQDDCSEFKIDRLVTDRLHNIAVGELAEFDIHNRTPRKPMTIGRLVLASLRVGSGIPLGDDLCEFARIHFERKTSFGSRLIRVNE